MAQGVPVYLDPYEKTDLKGQAMLIARIADTEAQTHHGITCQRWLVQFDEGQEYEAHWVDPNDFYLWALPFIGTGAFTFSRQSFNFNDATLIAWVRYGECPNITVAGTWIAAYLAPYPGRVRRVSFHSHCSGVVGSPGQLTLRPILNATAIDIIDVDDYTDTNVYNYQLSDDWDDKPFVAGDTLSAFLRSNCGPGDSLSHNYFTCTFHVQWGPYS